MITISSNSIDELNIAFKKLKKDFEALDGIKLNQDTMEYELILVKPTLDFATKSILDKVIDTLDLLDERILFKNLTWMKLIEQMEEEITIASLKPLKLAWNDLTTDKRKAGFIYLCKALEIDPIESETEKSVK